MKGPAPRQRLHCRTASAVFRCLASRRQTQTLLPPLCCHDKTKRQFFPLAPQCPDHPHSRYSPSDLKACPQQSAIPLRCEASGAGWRSEEHTSELQSQFHLVCRLLLEKNIKTIGASNIYTFTTISRADCTV